eukprot:282513-Rhodomonas_salina.1
MSYSTGTSAPFHALRVHQHAMYSHTVTDRASAGLVLSYEESHSKRRKRRRRPGPGFWKNEY